MTQKHKHGALITHAAAAAGVSSPLQIDDLMRGLLVIVNITAISGASATLTVIIEGQDDVSSAFYTILSSAGLTATGTTALTVMPGVTVTANVSAAAVMPINWRVRTTITGTTPAVTATISATGLN